MTWKYEVKEDAAKTALNLWGVEWLKKQNQAMIKIIIHASHYIPMFVDKKDLEERVAEYEAMGFIVEMVRIQE